MEDSMKPKKQPFTPKPKTKEDIMKHYLSKL